MVSFDEANPTAEPAATKHQFVCRRIARRADGTCRELLRQFHDQIAQPSVNALTSFTRGEPWIGESTEDGGADELTDVLAGLTIAPGECDANDLDTNWFANSTR